ncbi:MAG: ROK family protein [Jatrophihabitantaceae bacterium]
MTASLPAASTVLAVDVGGTGIKAALCDHDCTVLAATSRGTPVADGVPAVLAAIHGVIEELSDQARFARLEVAGVGLILPGVVDSVAGIARYSANIGWRELAIRDLVADRVGLPVAIEHDVRAAGLAEARLGAARGVPDAVFVGIGTGIAAAGIVGGRLLTGAGNQAGEIGHQPVIPDGERCRCGQRGCAETYASAAAIARRYRDRTGRTATAAEVIALAGEQDPVAAAVFDEALTALARALIGCVLLLDPQLIVLGGGLSLAGDALLRPLTERVAAGLAWRSPVPLLAAHFGARSGQIGAALIGWQAAASR